MRWQQCSWIPNYSATWRLEAADHETHAEPDKQCLYVEFEIGNVLRKSALDGRKFAMHCLGKSEDYWSSHHYGVPYLRLIARLILRP